MAKVATHVACCSFHINLYQAGAPILKILTITGDGSDQLESVAQLVVASYLMVAEASNGNAAQLYHFQWPHNSPKPEKKTLFKFQSNPAKQRLHLTFFYAAQGQILILDGAGKTVFTESISAPEQDLNISSLIPEAYFLVVITNKGSTFTQSIFIE